MISQTWVFPAAVMIPTAPCWTATTYQTSPWWARRPQPTRCAHRGSTAGRPRWSAPISSARIRPPPATNMQHTLALHRTYEISQHIFFLSILRFPYSTSQIQKMNPFCKEYGQSTLVSCSKLIPLSPLCNCRWWRITRLEEGLLLCGSPRLPSHSCGSKPAWTDHQTTSAPCGTGWAEQKTAADVSQAAAMKRPSLPSWRELLQPAESHNTPSWSENTNTKRADSLFIKEEILLSWMTWFLHDVG